MFSHLMRAIKQEPKSLLLIDKMIADWPLLGSMLLVVKEESAPVHLGETGASAPSLALVPDWYSTHVFDDDVVMVCSVQSIVDGDPHFFVGDLSVVSYLVSRYE